MRSRWSKGHLAAVTALVFSPDGALLVTGARDGVAVLWDVADPARPVPVATVGTPAPTRRWLRRAGPAVGVSLSGRLLAVGGETVRIWDITDPAHPVPTAVLSDPGRYRAEGHAVGFSPDGGLLAVGSTDIVVLWDVTDPARPAPAGRLRTQRWLSLSSVHAVAFSPDGRLLAADGGPALIVADVTDPARPARIARRRTFPGSAFSAAATCSLAFGPDGRLLASAAYSRNSTPYGSSGQSAVLLWDLTDPAHPARTAVTGHRGAVRAVAVGPDGRWMVSGGDDRTVLLWDVTDPAHPRQPGAFTRDGAVQAVAISPDGRLVATGGADPTPALRRI